MNVLVLSGYGINCENETLHAFEVVGFKGKIVHINDLIQNPKQLNNYQVFSTERVIIKVSFDYVIEDC